MDEPENTLQEIIMEAGWFGFVKWAVTQPDLLAQFTHDTGLNFPAPRRSGLEVMIDAATGYAEHREAERRQTLERFVEWATETYWGLEEAPRLYREKVARDRLARSQQDDCQAPLSDQRGPGRAEGRAAHARRRGKFTPR
jgi:hypothetical protein